MTTLDFMVIFQQETPDKQELWQALRELGDVASISLFIEELKRTRERLLEDALAQSPQTQPEEDFGRFNRVDYSSLATAALDALKVIVLNQEYEDAEIGLVSQYLLPICLASYRCSRSPLHKWLGFSQMGKHEARQDLAEWLNTRAYQGHGHLREEVLRSLAALLKNQPVKGLRPRRRRGEDLGPLSVGKAQSVCWTISAVGFATPEIIEPLQFVAKRRDDAGATALSCLAGLGISPERNSYTGQLFQEWLVHCASEGRTNRWLSYPMTHWANPNDFELIQQSFSRPVRRRARPRQQKPSKPRYSTYRYADLEDGARVLCQIASYYPEFSQWNESVWKILLKWHQKYPSLGTSLFLGSSLSPRVNCPAVAGEFLTELLPQTEQKSHPRSLLYMRLDECLLPQYIKGLLSLNVTLGFGRLWHLLADDALLNTAQPRYNIRTSEMTVKRGAWKILFSCGTFEGIARIEEGLRGEENGSTQASLLKRSAFFVLPQLPATALALVEETVDLTGSLHMDDFVAHLAAQKLAGSQGTLDALRLLLRFGLTWDGQIMLETVKVIDQLAVEVARAGQREAVTKLLFETAFGMKEETQYHRRRAAISALRELSIYGQLDSNSARQIAELAQQFKPYSPQVGQLMEACGFALRMDDEPRTDEIQLEPKIREEIEDWLWSFVEEDISEADIPEEDPSYHEEMNDSELVNPKWRALAALIHCGWWSENLPASPRRERFYQESNLIVDAQGETNLTARLIDLKSVNQESAFVLGLLFLRSPKVFVSALLELLEDQTEDEYDGRNNTFLSIARLLTGQKKMRDYSPRIDRALCLHAAQQQTNFMARPYWFEALVGYSPDALVHFNWVDYMADWNSLARSGLAQAVAESIPRLSGPEERRKAREMAQILTLDGEFGVRRNAYRALHDLPDERGKSCLEELMNLWSQLGQDQLQVELRQRAAEGAGWLSSLRLLDKLMHDPEKCVRDVARKSLDARRKRDLADSYLNKIIHAARATIIPKDQKNFNEQSSAFVSSQLSPVSLESATSNNGIVLRALPYGEALTHLGEDQHIEALRDFSRNQRLPGHVFYWLETIFTETQEQWDKTTKGWPKPWRDLREAEEALTLFRNGEL